MPCSQETRQKISEANKGKIHSKNGIKRKSRDKKYEESKMTPIACYDLNMNLIKTYKSQTEAALDIQRDQSSINRALKDDLAKCKKMY